MDADKQHSNDVFANFICDFKQLKCKQLKFWRIFYKVEVFSWFTKQVYFNNMVCRSVVCK
jgi:hypothetical protein